MTFSQLHPRKKAPRTCGRALPNKPLNRSTKSWDFRRKHILQILETFDGARGPLDRFVHLYFRQNRSLGSKDRAHIAQQVYQAVRYRELLNRFCRPSEAWAERLNLLEQSDLVSLKKRCKGDLAGSESIPAPLFDLLNATFDKPTLQEQCRLINTSAPIAMRVNALKGDRNQLMSLLPKEFGARFSNFSDSAIVLERREALFNLEIFRAGWFELQDEGSQLIASQVLAKPGDWVVDFCAGSGGKTLAIAPQLKKSGQIFLGDTRPKALLEAKSRLKRAGVQNAQVLSSEHAMWAKLKGRVDWVLTDVPCSGSGTLRRNPDMKEKIDGDAVKRLIQLQREIVQKALKLVKPGGKLCYSTCSLLKEENQDQIEYFCSQFGLKICYPFFQTLIVENGPDGFFAAVMQKAPHQSQ